MSDLSSEEKAFLASARDAWEPSSTSKTAVRAALLERLGAEAAFGADAPGPNSVPSPPASGLDRLRSALRGPWGVGTGVVVIGLCAATFYTRSADVPAPRAPEPTVQAPAPSPEPAPTARAAEAVSVDALPNAAQPAARPSAARAAVPAGSEPASSDTLAEELALLRSAQGSLRAGAPDDALATLAKHASRFPHGALRDERMTIQVLALCDRGDVAGAKALRDELARVAPGSSHVQRLSTSCAAR